MKFESIHHFSFRIGFTGLNSQKFRLDSHFSGYLKIAFATFSFLSFILQSDSSNHKGSLTKRVFGGVKKHSLNSIYVFGHILHIGVIEIRLIIGFVLEIAQSKGIAHVAVGLQSLIFLNHFEYQHSILELLMSESGHVQHEILRLLQLLSLIVANSDVFGTVFLERIENGTERKSKTDY